MKLRPNHTMTRILTRLAQATALAAVSLLPQAVSANSGEALMHFSADTGNLPSVQRGARNFMAYCSGCHSMKYLRYNRMGEDLNIPDEKLNVNGGAIALGHAMGATGSALVGMALDELERRDARRAVIAICGAAGVAVAMVIERL